MSDEGRARRHQVEQLQGRLKQAQLELEAAHSEGFPEQLDELVGDWRAAEAEAQRCEREQRESATRLEKFRGEVEEAERRVLAPKTVASVSPASALLLGVGVVLGIGQLASMFAEGPTPTNFLVLGGLLLVPPPVLAWIWRRRFGGGRTS